MPRALRQARSWRPSRCDDLVSQMVPYCQRKLAPYEGNQEATVKAALKGLLAKR
jgi:hypothetical protein